MANRGGFESNSQIFSAFITREQKGISKDSKTMFTMKSEDRKHTTVFAPYSSWAFCCTLNCEPSPPPIYILLLVKGEIT